ncbi:M1 family aminopeptidase, partial [Alphaproteobacteria bacterium]|nr:M1 family aminopeptidase [Alphaproteobacteria bacterium]
MPPSTNTPEVIHLRDYRPPNHLIDSIALKFVLEAGQTTVTADVRGYRNPAAGSGDLPLVLHGRDQEILSFQVNGSALNAADWAHDDEVLQLADPGASFHYQVVSRFDPAANTALEGLYVSHGMYCTQCEAEGFRRITYFPDRPDVMTTFQVRIEADKALYPKLLSNGNLTAEGDLDDGRHFAEWHDPFAKPAYLFALVAGDLDHLDDQFTTASGRTVALQIFVEKGEVAKARYAMDALKRSMAWDEETFGLEYDLDKFMIVAVSHFNMGAMENKGLNIFNSAYILADITTATDTDFENIEAVVAHEYFHNWTGNRVTCRDWFQLSLKEGLTVYRDQEFSSDMGSRAVNRIQSVE